MNEEIEAKLTAKLPALRKKEHILHWSAGADSIAAHIRMRGWGIEPKLVYMYFIEDLPLVNNYIAYYESKMKCHIYRLPNPLFWTMFEGGMLQRPAVGNPLWRYVGTLGWGAYTKKTYNACLAENYPDHMQAFGLRVSDGINRAAMLKNKGPAVGNNWYPCASFGFNDVKKTINEAGVKLPLDYAMWGMSFESPRWWMMPALKKECPATYKRILYYFPMANLMSAQAEAIGKGMPGGAKRRLTIYAGMSIDKGALTW